MTLYLIHGFCMNNSIWDKIVHKLSATKIVLLSLPGYNTTEGLTYENIESLAASYAELINEPGIVVGHSMGGYLALQICQLFPEKIKALVLFHSHAYADDDAKVEGRKKHISFLQKHGAQKFYKEVMPNFFYKKENKAIAGLINNAANMQVDVLINDLELMIKRKDTTDFLAQTDIPVAFIIGKYDVLIDNSSWFRQSSLPKTAGVYVLKKSAHMGMLEEPSKSAEAINHFITTCSLL